MKFWQQEEHGIHKPNQGTWPVSERAVSITSCHQKFTTSILPIGKRREVLHNFVQAHDKFVLHCILMLLQLFYNQFTYGLLQNLKK